MTRNEMIAEKMGWVYTPDDYMRDGQWGNRFNFKQFVLPEDWGVVMKLIERIVGDGWEVATYHSPTYGHAATARRDPVEFPYAYSVKTGDHMPDFPTAVVELFCRVYGITV